MLVGIGSTVSRGGILGHGRDVDGVLRCLAVSAQLLDSGLAGLIALMALSFAFIQGISVGRKAV